MKHLANKVVAITGAASGIGQALAIGLAKEGCNIAITDINETGLQDTVKKVEALGVTVTAQKLDVSDRIAMEAWAAKVVEDHGEVNVIINNAGVALSATIEDMKYEDFEWLMSINFWGVVYGTKAFLPHLKKAESGHIINISSVFGLIGIPTLSAYNSAKFAVRGFTEALRQELEIAGYNISCSSIHPGGIKTNIANSARLTEGQDLPLDKQKMGLDFDKIATTTSEQAAASIIKGLKRNKRRVLVGPDAKAFDIMQRLMPTIYQKLVAATIRRGSKKLNERPA
ncbi:MAG: SDR family NAD(P)-dependent oxidoreductase [Pseudomonadales bacterium]|nr:SDR family NAD(P)-dependent oxidoreductase [Pseudomonadales bacterium]